MPLPLKMWLTLLSSSLQFGRPLCAESVDHSGLRRYWIYFQRSCSSLKRCNILRLMLRLPGKWKSKASALSGYVNVIPASASAGPMYTTSLWLVYSRLDYSETVRPTCMKAFLGCKCGNVTDVLPETMATSHAIEMTLL